MNIIKAVSQITTHTTHKQRIIIISNNVIIHNLFITVMLIIIQAKLKMKK